MADDPGAKGISNKAEIILVIRRYDDIFSDFDPRPYNQRALSEDFLFEARRATLDKHGGIELRFLIKKSHRSQAIEGLARSRLKDHFRKHYNRIIYEFRKRNRRAVGILAIGLAIGFADALLIFSGHLSGLAQSAVEITFTPTSWYMIWMGLDRLLTKPRKDRANAAFYKKMKDASIVFATY
ncbi:MAG: hypothetical protein KGH60_01300 [Candidatus Micrarchaeota archaeon]|nr:hypothetical protein [Candidatus Micrarchaeota archaeon]